MSAKTHKNNKNTQNFTFSACFLHIFTKNRSFFVHFSTERRGAPLLRFHAILAPRSLCARFSDCLNLPQSPIIWLGPRSTARCRLGVWTSLPLFMRSKSQLFEFTIFSLNWHFQPRILLGVNILSKSQQVSKITSIEFFQ